MNIDNDPLQVAREFGDILDIPVFLVDPNGDLRFYNDEAGKILGMSFGMTGPMPASVWGRIFVPADESGSPLMPETLPLMRALTERRPVTGSFWIRGIDNKRRHIQVSAFPIPGSGGEGLGALAVFWELES
jgi:PAS domain-containing protein